MITQESPSLSQLEQWKELFFKNCPIIVNDTFQPVSKLGRMWYQIREKCCCGQRIITDPDRVRECAIQAIQPAFDSQERFVPRMAHYVQGTVLAPFLKDTIQETMIAFSKHILSKRHLPAGDAEVLSYLKETFSMKDEDIVSSIEIFNLLNDQEKLRLMEKMPECRLHLEVFEFFLIEKRKILASQNIEAYIQQELLSPCIKHLYITYHALSIDEIRSLPADIACQIMVKLHSMDNGLSSENKEKYQALQEVVSTLNKDVLAAMPYESILQLGDCGISFSDETNIQYLNLMQGSEDFSSRSRTLQKAILRSFEKVQDYSTIDPSKLAFLAKELSNLTDSYSPKERSALARSMIIALEDDFDTLDFETKKDLIQFLLEDPSTKQPLIYSSIKKMSLDELQFILKRLSNSKKQDLLDQLKGKLVHLSNQKRKIFSDVKKELSKIADTTSIPQQLPVSIMFPFEEL